MWHAHELDNMYKKNLKFSRLCFFCCFLFHADVLDLMVISMFCVFASPIRVMSDCVLTRDKCTYHKPLLGDLKLGFVRCFIL